MDISEYYWLLLSVLVAALFGLVNTFDKNVVQKYVRDPMLVVVFVSLIGVIPTLIIFLYLIYTQILWVPNNIFLISIFLGVLFTLFTFLYFRSLSYMPIDVAVGVLQVSALFSVVWGLVFFKEEFGVWTYVGIAMVLIGLISLSIYRSYSKKTGTRPWPREVWNIIFAAVLLSIGFALQKYATSVDNVSPWTIFFYSRLGNLMVIAILFAFVPGLAKKTVYYIYRYRDKIIYVILAELLYYSTIIIRLFAVSIGQLTTVATFVTAQPFFVTLYALIGERFGYQDKHYKSQNIALRLLLVITIVGGGILIAWDYKNNSKFASAELKVSLFAGN